MRRARCGWVVLLAAGLALGCRGKPAGPARPRTGAEQCARAWFEALVRRDWPSAYDALDAQSRGRCSGEQFARRAAVHAGLLGFQPSRVQMVSCDERGDEAVAHARYRGGEGSAPKVRKDAVGLRRGPAGWGVVLPDSFGAVR
jgi:hypothetical protein